NEISYRFNRRKFKNELFNRVLNCCALTKTITYPELTR
ncbi:MAG: IS1595 family transposase, partial [Candidatus Contubernalis sp.]|nr:IS1595 family transposase [Candidatus Contubernalis sp.]